MRPTIFSIVPLATVLLACAHDPVNARSSVASTEERSERQASQQESVAEQRTDQEVERAEARAEPSTGHAADNTGVNERDRDGANVTPMDQGNGEVDLDLTQRIRKAVMADDSLSFTAKNAKIITRDGLVTLRGPVKSAAEKDAVYKCAVSAAGVGHVTNELEVESH